MIESSVIIYFYVIKCRARAKVNRARAKVNRARAKVNSLPDTKEAA